VTHDHFSPCPVRDKTVYKLLKIIELQSRLHSDLVAFSTNWRSGRGWGRVGGGSRKGVLLLLLVDGGPPHAHAAVDRSRGLL
jgi:hypothetical protein